MKFITLTTTMLLFSSLLTVQTLTVAATPMHDLPLSPAAASGQASIGVCLSCHNQELDPPLAPPLFGVQKRYKMMFPEKVDFVANMVAFVKNPRLDKAIMRRPVNKLGLMPAMDLPEDQLSDIANYIYEASFEYPCRHWEIAVKNATAKGQVDPHILKDKQLLSRYCK